MGRLLPAILDSSLLAFKILGAAYGLFGLFLLVYGVVRWRSVQNALKADRPLPSDQTGVMVTAAATVALAVATIAMVLVAK